MSALADHRKNAEMCPRASVLVHSPARTPSPLTRPRATVLGRIEQTERSDELRASWLERHPEAERFIDFRDFAFFRLRVERVRYVAGFGRMGWLTQQQWARGEIDPLGEIAPYAIDHMNDDHADNLLDIARAELDADWPERVTMVHVDRLGFDVVLSQGARVSTGRVAFEEPVRKPQALRAAMASVSAAARARL